LAVAVVSLPLTVFGASAQGIHIGPDGVGVDTGMRDHQRVVREYEDDDGCAIRVIRYRRGDGDVVTRRERRC
jgi:hypothetical protein